jgi:hypothetical protein
VKAMEHNEEAFHHKAELKKHHLTLKIIKNDLNFTKTIVKEEDMDEKANE